jgi:hypothetical protein
MAQAKRRKRRKVTPRQVAWLLVAVFALWPLIALSAGYEASWPMIIATSIASATLVWLLDHRNRRRRAQQITTLPKSNMAKPAARPNAMKVLKPLTEEPKLPTRQTRTRDKLAAAQELAYLHGYGDELKATWDALEVTDARTADVVTQREIELQANAETLATGQALSKWLGDSDEKHRREAS